MVLSYGALNEALHPGLSLSRRYKRWNRTRRIYGENYRIAPSVSRVGQASCFPNLPALSGAETASGQTIIDAYRLAGHFIQPAGLIADAHQEHGLVGVLEQVDNPLLLVFEVNRLAVGDQVEVRARPG